MIRPGEVPLQQQEKSTNPPKTRGGPVAVADSDRSSIPFDPESGRFNPRSFLELQQLATLIAKTDFAPKSMRGKPEDVFVAMWFGAGMGLQPLQSIQNIATINGKPSLYGDAIPALVQSSSVVYRNYFMLDMKELPADFTPPWKHDDYPDGFGAVVRGSRDGGPEVVRAWSVAMAKNAGLWNKDGPWKTYPHTMLYRRAMGDFAKAIVPDRMLGLIPSQEAQDMPPEVEFVDMPTEAPGTAEVERQRDPVCYPTGEPVECAPRIRTEEQSGTPASPAATTKRWNPEPETSLAQEAAFQNNDTTQQAKAGMADPIPLRPEDEERLSAAATRGDVETKKVRRKRMVRFAMENGGEIKTAGITAGTYNQITGFDKIEDPPIYREEIRWFIGELNLSTSTIDNLREDEGDRLLRHLRKIHDRLIAAGETEKQEEQEEQEEQPAPELPAEHPSPETLIGTVEGAVEEDGKVYMKCPNRAGDLMTPDFCRSGCGPASSECPAWDPLPQTGNGVESFA